METKERARDKAADDEYSVVPLWSMQGERTFG